MYRLPFRWGAAAWLGGQVLGCRDNCSADTYGCDDGRCGVVWDCGGDTREIHVGLEGECECIHDGEAVLGQCSADLCRALEGAAQRAIPEGDMAFDHFDELVNDACGWNIQTVSPLVLGACLDG
jgi:hypothetical protein